MKGKQKGELKKVAENVNVGEDFVAFPMMDEELYNFDTYNACNLEGNDDQLIYYDWLVDSATTSHITHQ
jgi:hypothetical protein